MTTKICTKCNLNKPLADFSRSKTGKYGVNSRCRLCVREYNATYYKISGSRNREKYKESQSEWRNKTKAVKRVKDKAWRAANIEARKSVEKAYRLANAEKISEKNRKLYQRTKSIRALQTSEWAKANRAAKNYSSRRYMTLRRQSLAKWASSDAIRTVYEKANELSIKFGIRFEVDHIVPLKSEIVCGLHCEDNLQLLAASLNRSKSNVEWPDMP